MSAAGAPIRLDEVWDFCHARLDETATALVEYRDGHKGPCINRPGQNPADYDDHDSCCLHLAAAEASPYRDVQYGLADIAFKRLMLEEHEPDLQAAVKDSTVTPMIVCRTDGDDCPFTQGIAALYNTHPDYKESWRP
ncbi:DUF6221 family protein [Streptomyces sp. NPDC006335]|uniref:DUF6221 family protein n=1 Tax=Streptomyces sp. NPDC006335 TaxID=3156895 RepID=UPI0033AD6396